MSMTRPQKITSDAAYSEGNSIVFSLFLLYVVFTYLQGGIRYPALGAIRLEFILGAILTPIALLSVRRLRTFADSRKILNCGLALLLCMGLMVIFSRYPAVSWEAYWNRGIKFALFGLCIAAFVSSPRTLLWFLGAFLFSFFRMGFEGILGTIDGSLIWENQEIPRLHGTTPSYAHPNSFSGTQLGALPYSIYLFPLLPWYLRAALALQMVFIGNVVLRTGSRTGYLGFIAGLFSMVWLAKHRNRTILITLTAALVAIPLIPQEYTARFSSIFEDTSLPGEDTSVGQRKEILVDALQVFSRYPLGVGVAAFPQVRSSIFGRSQDTHNLYLEVATNLGVQGVVVFLIFVVALWAVLTRLRISTKEQILKLQAKELNRAIERRHLRDISLLHACAKATWVFLIIRLTLGGFGMDLYEIYWWFVAGLTVAMVRINHTSREMTDEILRSHKHLAQPEA